MGHGFAEKVHEAAFAILLGVLGLKVVQQRPIEVYFHGRIVGGYNADKVVDGVVLIELKAFERLTGAHEAQLPNYLKATEIEVGLLLNFGLQAEFRRKIFDNDRKGSRSWMKIP